MERKTSYTYATCYQIFQSGEESLTPAQVCAFIVAFRSAKEWEDATFAERKATLVFRTMLGVIGTVPESTEKPLWAFGVSCVLTNHKTAGHCRGFGASRG